MGLQYSISVRTAKLEAVETEVGASAQLRVFAEAQPANCAAADPATLLVEMALPADWMDTASGAAKVKLGVWSGVAVADGAAGCWRIYDTAFGECMIQGDMNDLVLDNPSPLTGQTITVAAFTIVAGNG